MRTIWQDFGRSAFAKYDVPLTEPEIEVQKKVKRWAEASPGKEHMFFAVCLSGQMIGYVDFHKNDEGYECSYCLVSQDDMGRFRKMYCFCQYIHVYYD